jgi:hypothetical protein
MQSSSNRDSSSSVSNLNTWPSSRQIEAVFRDVMSYSSAEIYWCFEGTHSLHLQSLKVSHAKKASRALCTQIARSSEASSNSYQTSQSHISEDCRPMWEPKVQPVVLTREWSDPTCRNLPWFLFSLQDLVVMERRKIWHPAENRTLLHLTSSP